MKSFINWFKNLKSVNKLLLGAGVIGVLAIASASASQSPATQIPISKKIDDFSQVQSQPVITTNTEIETQSIPFTATTVDDASLTKGMTKITTVGVNGSQTLTYRVTYTDGQQTDKQLIDTKVTNQPTTQVTSIGTYVAQAPVQSPTATTSSCDSNYSGACVPIASDVDCAGGNGNGPAYVRGPVKIIGSDIYGLDRDGDGIGCE